MTSIPADVRDRILAARTPADLFGTPDGDHHAWLATARHTYKRLSRLVHPDGHGDDDEARDLFARLSRLWRQAQDGEADDDTPPTVIGDHGTYTIRAHVSRDDVGDAFLCTDETGVPALLRVAHHLADEDLIRAEADVLAHLHRTADPTDPALAFIPAVREHFYFTQDGRGEPRCANALDMPSDRLFTLGEVRQAYPHGIDPRSFAWIWRRLLGALALAHAAGTVHGAVLPHNVLVDADHRLVLAGWPHATCPTAGTAAHIPAVDRGHRHWYPPETLAKANARPAVDLALAAKTMTLLLGGDPTTGSFPAAIPTEIRTHLRALGTLHVDDAGLTLRTFDALLDRIWGPRTFHPFTMPERPAHPDRHHDPKGR